MDISVECFDCILNQIMPLVRAASPSEQERRALIRRMLRIVAEAEKSTTPPDIAAAFHREVRTVSGNNDLFRTEKDESTRIALSLYPEMSEIVRKSHDPFETALRLAIGGNIIDYGVDPSFDLTHVERKIREVLTLPLDLAAVRTLRRAIDAADSVFYILDNCGEAVFDRLLLEQMPPRVTLGVRGQPILNDVTRREATMSGLDAYPILDTGDLTPGVSAHGTREEFLRAMQKADLVIAKGQGNFETLSDYPRPIAHLLRVKCPVVGRIFEAELHSLQVKIRNLDQGEN